MVMPRSRSMSIESRYWSLMSRAFTAPVSSRMRSESVDLPWSMWATIDRLRILSGAVGEEGSMVIASQLSVSLNGQCPQSC